MFHVHLPRLQQTAPAAASDDQPAQVRGGQEGILLVEDEPQLREVARETLRSHGYRVFEADSGRSALRLWQQHRDAVDLLLTDLVMPEGISGGDLARKLHEGNPELKVIFMSGYAGEVADGGLPLHEGINFLQKPFTSLRLAQLVRNRLDGVQPEFNGSDSLQRV
jgi:two-component system, cell cycle sensor histidine kinase and response regulator CckA